MALSIEKTFVVKAPPAAVWAFMADPRRVARCMPGAAITDQLDDQTWAGTITVKVGPVTATYKGKMKFEKLDAAARAAEIAATGQDVKGKGGAELRLKSQLRELAPSETEVATTSEVNVSGMLAQFGRGMIQDVSDQLFQKFTDAMRAELEKPVEASATAAAGPPAQAPPVQMLSVGGKAILRQPAFWIVLAAIVGFILFFVVRT
jgi:carbon monoxide dehydrogenase subunit G